MSPDPRHEQFLRLFLTCQPRLFAYIRSLVFSRADADDVMQETALVLWAKFDEFEAGTHFDRWAYRIAHLQVKALWKKQSRERLRFSDSLVEQLAGEMMIEGDRLEATHGALTHCLEKLPERDRALVRHRYRPDTTSREVAAAIGRSESAVSRALNRIYLLLLACIAATLEPPRAGNPP